MGHSRVKDIKLSYHPHLRHASAAILQDRLDSGVACLGELGDRTVVGRKIFIAAVVCPGADSILRGQSEHAIGGWWRRSG
jgi:hypothetical protein